MSADNAILVINFNNNEWAVEHVQALENLYWKWNAKTLLEEIVPQRLFEFFINAKRFNIQEDANKEALRELEDTGHVEYGIIQIDVPYNSWNALVDLSVKEISEEIQYMKDDYIGNNKEIWIQGLEETLNLLNKEIEERK
jgi:hypothetical protein